MIWKLANVMKSVIIKCQSNAVSKLFPNNRHLQKLEPKTENSSNQFKVHTRRKVSKL